MSNKEIEVPKEIREFLPQEAKETFLGQKNGAKKQYRYGNLHIREYDNKYLVHMDKVDPRKDPLGHLFADAPEVIIGLASALFGGKKISSISIKKNNPKINSIMYGILGSLVLGYIGYSFSKKIKNYKW